MTISYLGSINITMQSLNELTELLASHTKLTKDVRYALDNVKELQVLQEESYLKVMGKIQEFLSELTNMASK